MIKIRNKIKDNSLNAQIGNYVKLQEDSEYARNNSEEELELDIIAKIIHIGPNHNGDMGPDFIYRIEWTEGSSDIHTQWYRAEDLQLVQNI